MLNSPREYKFLQDTLNISKHLKNSSVSALREATAKANHYHTAKGYRAHLRKLDEKESRIHIEGDVLHFGFYLELPSELSKTMWMDAIYDNLAGLSRIVRWGYTLTELEHTEWDMAALHFSCSCNIIPMVTSTVLMELFQHYGQSTYATHQGKTFAGLTMEEVGLKHPLLLKELFLASTQNDRAEAERINMGKEPYDHMLADYIYNFISPVYRMDSHKKAELARSAWKQAFGSSVTPDQAYPTIPHGSPIEPTKSFVRDASKARSLLFDGPEFSKTRAAVSFTNDVRLVPTGLFILAGEHKSISDAIFTETLTGIDKGSTDITSKCMTTNPTDDIRVMMRSDPDVIHMGTIRGASDFEEIKKAAQKSCVIVHIDSNTDNSTLDVYERLVKLQQQAVHDDDVPLSDVLRGIFLHKCVCFGCGVAAIYHSQVEMEKRGNTSLSELIVRMSGDYNQ